MTDELKLPDLGDKKPEPDKPPKKDRKPRTRKPKPTDAKLKESLDAAWVGVGGGLLLFDPYCGGVLITRGGALTDALIDVGKVNPRVRKALEAFTQTSMWGGLAAAGAAVAVPIMAHHGLLPTDLGKLMGPTVEDFNESNLDGDSVTNAYPEVSDEPEPKPEPDDEPAPVRIAPLAPANIDGANPPA